MYEGAFCIVTGLFSINVCVRVPKVTVFVGAVYLFNWSLIRSDAIF
jgi:hypothetical protein